MQTVQIILELAREIKIKLSPDALIAFLKSYTTQKAMLQWTHTYMYCMIYK